MHAGQPLRAPVLALLLAAGLAGAPACGGASGVSGGSFACGPSVTCDGRVQVCKIGEGGAVAPDGGANVSYSCVAIPASCSQQVSCACIGAALGAQACTNVSGDVTVTFQYP